MAELKSSVATCKKDKTGKYTYRTSNCFTRLLISRTFRDTLDVIMLRAWRKK